MNSAYLLTGCRTPIGKLQGVLAGRLAVELGAAAVGETLRRAQLEPDSIDQAILGIVLAAGVGQAPARQAALQAGLLATVPALSINKMCGSGLMAVMLADQAIRAGDAQRIVAGGMESMSRAPHLAMGSRAGWKYGHQTLLDSLVHDGLWCPSEQQVMGMQAERLAEQYQITRFEQDQYALASHQQALIGQTARRPEIVPITVPAPRGSTLVEHDEGPRADATMESLARLEPAFDPAGTVTAGNASQLSDGAAAVLVADESTAREFVGPLKARIMGTAVAAVEPSNLFYAPVPAIQAVLAKTGWSIDQLDLIELNEAFAVQCLVAQRELDIDPQKLNVVGGAIALGHPIGASGARILVTLLHTLAERGLRRGLAAACLAGGEAVAMAVERVGEW